jgi:hypothetical protein
MRVAKVSRSITMDSFFSNTLLSIDTVQHGKNNKKNVCHEAQDTVNDHNTERAVEISLNGKSCNLCSMGIISDSISSDTDLLSHTQNRLVPTPLHPKNSLDAP